MSDHLTQQKKRKPVLVAGLFIVTAATFFAWGALTVKEQVFPYAVGKSVYTFVGDSEKPEEAKAKDSKTKDSKAKDKKTVEKKEKDKKPIERHETNKLWASKIASGGYILHFRHAHREKWNEVAAFDAYAVYSGSDAESSTFAKATCLTPQGIEEARLIGKIFEINGVQIENVVSSPSCRAVQTARYAFGKVDAIDVSLLNRGAMMKDQWGDFANQLRDLFLKHSPTQGKNTIFSGHGSTLKYDAPKIFESNEVDEIDERQETGFVVIENVGGKLIARYKFDSITEYASASLRFPLSKAE